MRVRTRSSGSGGQHHLGNRQNQPFQLSFNASLNLDFWGSRVSSNGGLIFIRELDERLGFSEPIEQHLKHSRAQNARLPFTDLRRQSVYSRLSRYEDVNDTERLCHDPTLLLIGRSEAMD
jgi:hypothetical protein